MANHEIVDPHIFTDTLRELTTEDRGHADTFNELFAPLINNDVYLKEHTVSADRHISDEEKHVTPEDKDNWNSKASTAVATTSVNGLMSKDDKTKLNGIASGAEVNQNAISKIKSGSNTVESNAKSATVELKSGNKIEIVADNATKRITISLLEDGLQADTVDGKHAKVTLNTSEKSDLAGAVNEVLQLLTGHTGDSVKHVTAADKTNWSNKYTKTEVDNKLALLETKIDWKESVATYANIATTYPNPEDGWTVNVKDTDYTYRYNGNSWVVISANAIPKATASVDGLMTKEYASKLNGIAAGANNYTHPSTHPASMITQDSTHRFATDTEKGTWNAAQQNAINAIKGLMVNQQTNDASKIPTSALVYAMQQTIAAQQQTIATLNSTFTAELNELNRNIEPHTNISFFSNMFSYSGSSTGLGATFPGMATSSKITSNMYRIDVHCTMLVTNAPDDYFAYGVYAAIICEKLLGKLPTRIEPGHCTVYNPDGTLAVGINEYGARLVHQGDYCLSIGRYYTADGNYGSWSLGKFLGHNYFLDGFFFVCI